MRGLLERAACVLVPCRVAARLGAQRARARRTWSACRNPVAMRAGSRKDPCRPNLVLFLGHMAAEQGRVRPARGGRGGARRGARPAPGVRGRRRPPRGRAPRRAPRHRRRGQVHRLGRPVGQARAVRERRAARRAVPTTPALPMSLLEAMAAGVPVVAAAVGGIPEVVVDGVSGFLVAPGDSASLARVLRKLLSTASSARASAPPGANRCACATRPSARCARLEEIYAAIGRVAAARRRCPNRPAKGGVSHGRASPAGSRGATRPTTTRSAPCSRRSRTAARGDGIYALSDAKAATAWCSARRTTTTTAGIAARPRRLDRQPRRAARASSPCAAIAFEGDSAAEAAGARLRALGQGRGAPPARRASRSRSGTRARSA